MEMTQVNDATLEKITELRAEMPNHPIVDESAWAPILNGTHPNIGSMGPLPGHRFKFGQLHPLNNLRVASGECRVWAYAHNELPVLTEIGRHLKPTRILVIGTELGYATSSIIRWQEPKPDHVLVWDAVPLREDLTGSVTRADASNNLSIACANIGEAGCKSVSRIAHGDDPRPKMERDGKFDMIVFNWSGFARDASNLETALKLAFEFIDPHNGTVVLAEGVHGIVHSDGLGPEDMVKDFIKRWGAAQFIHTPRGCLLLQKPEKPDTLNMPSAQSVPNVTPVQEPPAEGVKPLKTKFKVNTPTLISGPSPQDAKDE